MGQHAHRVHMQPLGFFMKPPQNLDGARNSFGRETMTLKYVRPQAGHFPVFM